MVLLLAVLLGLIYTDIVGYFVHKLLHSGRIDFLYRLHMEHHLQQYPPHDLRSDTYRTTPQPKILGAGPEWALPIGSIMVLTAIIMGVLAPWWVTVTFFATALTYAFIAYAWLHDQFHLWNPLELLRTDSGISSKATFVLGATPIIKWFVKARDLHDVHHNNMKKNYGIGSYWLDKLLGTYQR